MSDASTFGGQLDPGTVFGASFNGENGPSSVGGGAEAAGPGSGASGDASPAPVPPMAPPPASVAGNPVSGFGAGLTKMLGGPQYTQPDPQMSALDQSADMLQQRVQRANAVAANPMLQLFNPEGVQAARQFVPAAQEQLQKIRAQQADIAAGRQQAATLGLAPGEVRDEASQADRVEVAKARALQGDLKVFKGLQAVDPKAAESIQDQVQEVAAGHLTRAQFAFDKLSNMRSEGEYQAAIGSLRKDGTLGDLENLGMKLPSSFEAFSASKAREGQALREARIGMDALKAKLQDRTTYQPMETKEADTYKGRLTTAYGDQITNGTWARNAATNARGFIVNGASDPRELGKSFTLATPEQRKSIEEESDKLVPKEDREKYRSFNRTYEMAKPTEEQAKRGDIINTNPNVQQGIAEALASTLRGGMGGANTSLLKLETAKRGAVQGLFDQIQSGYAGGMNTLAGKDVRPYMSKMTQTQVKDVLDFLKQYNEDQIGSRLTSVAKRAGALGLDAASMGFNAKEGNGALDDAIKEGTQAQVARMMPYHQAIGGGDGVFQIGAQRPGDTATSLPAGTQATTQLPGAPPLQTPVQQAQNPPPPASPGAGGGTPPGAPPQAVTQPASPGGGPIAPGLSPTYQANLQRIESGNEKDPWTAGAKGTSASGAFQFINSTWAANKPPGAPARAADATPEQQTQALATLTAKNVAQLQKDGLPVTDRNAYIAHNVGSGGARALLTAAPNADARTIVGDAAAKNNPLFFKGKPTVATVLARYEANMNGSLAQQPTEMASGEKPGLLTRVSRLLSQGVAGGDEAKDKAVADVGNAAVEHAPAIGSTAGAVIGAAGGPAGSVAGGAAGGGAGEALKQYLQGGPMNGPKIAGQAALGGVLGVASEARPVLAAAGRIAGAGAVKAGEAAAEGEDGPDIIDAGLKGAGAGAVGEGFGRAMGMALHKVYNAFTPSAQKAVQTAAAELHAANETLASEAPKLPGVGGAAGTANPKYEAAQAAKDKAEQTIKDLLPHAKPEEVAYAHKVTTETQELPTKREAQVAKPGEIEKAAVGKGYQQLEGEVGAAGVGAPKAAPKLSDGPIAAVADGKVSKDHAELAQRTEAAITAPAKDWQTKWNQLKDARSDLLKAERDAEASTVPGKTQIAKDMRTLADTVRAQQAKTAKYVFGEEDGKAFMGRLTILDARYRRFMDATNGGDIAAAAAMKGEAGREADSKFRAFAHDDPVALQAWAAMRKKGANLEQGVHDLVAAEKIPVLGKVFSAAKLAGSFNRWMRERTAGSPVQFKDVLPMAEDTSGPAAVRNLLGGIGARGLTM